MFHPFRFLKNGPTVPVLRAVPGENVPTLEK